MYNSAMTDASLKIINPSKTPNQKQGTL